MQERIAREFYARPTLTVARELLGQRMVRRLDGERLTGRIVEVEAYIGVTDRSSHARSGKTARNAAMFGAPGRAYVYLIYGLYHCLNLVTEADGFPAAVLIRALEPLEGILTQRQLRGMQRPLRDLTRGPGRLCQALAVDRRFDGVDLCDPQAQLWVEHDEKIPAAQIIQSPRIGVRGDTAALTARWRFLIRDNPWISRKPAN